MIIFPSTFFPAQSLLKFLLADTFLCKAIYFSFLSAAVIETIFAIAISRGISAPLIQYTLCHT